MLYCFFGVLIFASLNGAFGKDGDEEDKEKGKEMRKGEGEEAVERLGQDQALPEVRASSKKSFPSQG